jgi:hypothetical protein
VCQTLPAGSLSPFRCTNVTVNECDGYNGGCWQGDLGGKHYTACAADLSAKRAAGLAGVDPASVRGFTCTCPRGFAGDGAEKCTDVNECEAVPSVCPGEQMRCINAPGTYTCACAPGFAMDVPTMTCVPAGSTRGGGSSGSSSGGVSAGGVFGIVLLTFGAAGAAGYGLYRWRLKKCVRFACCARVSCGCVPVLMPLSVSFLARRHMSEEIRSIMSNYLPLGTPDDDFRPLTGGDEEEDGRI